MLNILSKEVLSEDEQGKSSKIQQIFFNAKERMEHVGHKTPKKRDVLKIFLGRYPA